MNDLSRGSKQAQETFSLLYYEDFTDILVIKN